MGLVKLQDKKISKKYVTFTLLLILLILLIVIWFFPQGSATKNTAENKAEYTKYQTSVSPLLSELENEKSNNIDYLKFDKQFYESKGLKKDLKNEVKDTDLNSKNSATENYLNYQKKISGKTYPDKNKDEEYQAKIKEEINKQKLNNLKERLKQNELAKNSQSRIDLNFKESYAFNKAKDSQNLAIFNQSENETLKNKEDRDKLSTENIFAKETVVYEDISPYTLYQGSVIPAILITGINSELKGQISAQITEHIYDSATGNFILIPKGSKIIGTYENQVKYGQRRLFVAFNRVILPNKKSFKLDSFLGSSTDGYSGFDAEVENHLWTLLTGALLVGTITSAQVAAATDSDGHTSTEIFSKSITYGVGNTLNQVIENNLNVAPTLTLKPGYLFNVTVTQDLAFKQPYKE